MGNKLNLLEWLRENGWLHNPYKSNEEMIDEFEKLNKDQESNGVEHTHKSIVVDDLQNQVREHIKSHDIFDWHEALTEEEMIYLENLMLTFAPMFSPGSIGFAKTVQPYLERSVATEDQSRNKS